MTGRSIWPNSTTNCALAWSNPKSFDITQDDLCKDKLNEMMQYEDPVVYDQGETNRCTANDESSAYHYLLHVGLSEAITQTIMIVSKYPPRHYICGLLSPQMQGIG
jgi:hypothetical protein